MQLKKMRILGVLGIRSFEMLQNGLTCARKSIAGVARIAGAIEAARYVGTSSKLTASSAVLSTFIHIYVSQCSAVVSAMNISYVYLHFSPLCRFTLWTFRHLDDSPPGRFAPKQ